MFCILFVQVKKYLANIYYIKYIRCLKEMLFVHLAAPKWAAVPLLHKLKEEATKRPDSLTK
jgi:hypothetical protein